MYFGTFCAKAIWINRACVASAMRIMKLYKMETGSMVKVDVKRYYTKECKVKNVD